jgi:hypothetical protein
MVANGTTRMWQRATLVREGDGWHYTEETVAGSAIRQTSEVWFTTSGAMLKVMQRGEAMGKPMRIDATFTGGRVRSSAVTPSAPNGVTVDSSYTSPVVDDNALQALIPAIRFERDSVIRWTVFSTGKGSTTLATIERIGVETVTTPTGPVQARRVRLSLERSKQDFVISERAPHTLLSIGAPGNPMQLRRAN